MTLLQLIDVVLTAMAAIVLLPTLAFCVECLAAVLPGRRKYLGAHDAVLADIINAPRPRAAVLIPAHDEQAVIEQTVRGLIPTLAPGDRLLVVADNCSDDTAELACRAGAEVVVRLQRRAARQGPCLGLRSGRLEPRSARRGRGDRRRLPCRTGHDGYPDPPRARRTAAGAGAEPDRSQPGLRGDASGLDAGEPLHQLDPAARPASARAAMPPDGHRHGHPLVVGQTRFGRQAEISSRTCNWASTWRWRDTQPCFAPRRGSLAVCPTKIGRL